MVACRLSETLKSVFYGKYGQKLLKWTESHKAILRIFAFLFIPLWFANAYFSIGFGTSTPDYIQMTRGTFYVLYSPSFWGIGPWWEKHWNFFCVYRPQPALWTDFDVATDGAGVGVPIWFVGACIFLFTFVPRLARFIIELAIFTPGRCRTCGYDLGGLPTNTCPECGKSQSM